MRVVTTGLLLLLLIQASAQADSVAFTYIQYGTKGFVVLNNREKVFFQGITVDKYSNVVLFLLGTNMVNGSYTYKNDVRAMNNRVISASAIRKIKIKRQSFASGALVGGAAGFGLGYLGGVLSFDYDYSQTDDENDSDRNARAFIYGVGAALPTALAGGFAGGIFIKKRFRINGDLKKLYVVLDKAPHLF